MSVEQVEYRSQNPPANLPSCDNIVLLCNAVGSRLSGTCFEIDGIPQFWVKYGGHITLGEALTQNQVSQIVNADLASVVRVPEVYFVFSRKGCRYIVMQHIAGETVASRYLKAKKYLNDDVLAVAAAIKRLINIRMPAGTPPGHVGGGLIGHDFFLECLSTLEYPTVEDLQGQINKICFYAYRNKLVSPQRFSVDFSSETAEGLVLCPSDIDPSNFIIDGEGTVFAIDFGCTGYMPPSFVSYSLERKNILGFTQLVARQIQYPESANLRAMKAAAGLFVIIGNNSLGIDWPLD